MLTICYTGICRVTLLSSVTAVAEGQSGSAKKNSPPHNPDIIHIIDVGKVGIMGCMAAVQVC
jgi:hypothetical protein